MNFQVGDLIFNNTFRHYGHGIVLEVLDKVSVISNKPCSLLYIHWFEVERKTWHNTESNDVQKLVANELSSR